MTGVHSQNCRCIKLATEDAIYVNQSVRFTHVFQQTIRCKIWFVQTMLSALRRWVWHFTSSLHRSMFWAKSSFASYHSLDGLCKWYWLDHRVFSGNMTSLLNAWHFFIQSDGWKVTFLSMTSTQIRQISPCGKESLLQKSGVLHILEFNFKDGAELDTNPKNRKCEDRATAYDLV